MRKTKFSGKKRFTLALCLLLLAGTLAAVFAIHAEEPYVVYASDLTPTSATSTAGDSYIKFDKGENDSALKFRNAGNTLTFEKGIFAHADSEIKYDIQKYGIQNFSATLGINDSGQNYSADASAKFFIYADSQLLYESENILRIDSAVEKVDVKIPSDAKMLILKTDKADEKNWADHTVWADAKFTLDAEKGGVLNDISLTLPTAILSEGETVKATLSATAIGGREIDPAKLTVSYKSSETSVATVENDGTITAKKEGATTITATAEKDGVKCEASVNIQCVAANSTSKFLLHSPGQNISLLLTLDSGALHYSVLSGGKTIVEPSLIGFEGTGFKLASGFTYSTKSTVSEINETYKNYSGDYAQGHDHCMEQTVTFTNSGYTYKVVMRAYDDGFAVRSVIDKAGTKTITITDEKTNYVIPAGTDITAILKSESDMSVGYSYEDGYSSTSIDTVAKGRYVMYPAMMKYGDGLYALLSEAELYRDNNVMYGSCLLAAGNRTLELAPAPKKSASVTVNLPFTSPWRMGVVGDLKTLVESDIVDNLNERRADHDTADYSWIQPGVTAWMWLSEGFQGQRTVSTIKDYVDLASEMGWKYLILDEGWQPASTTSDKAYNGYFSYFPELIEYADSKGVGFLVWVKHVDLDTDKEREVLHEWAEMGIKGIKADFFDTEEQVNISDMQKIYEICMKEHLLVNFHGANKPTGERSTYPCVINRESLNGQEYGGVWSTNTTVWPYTRAAIGPSDITPTLYPTASSTTTAAQQIAINVVFEAGFPCMAGDTEDYRNSSIKSYFKALPAKWDDLKFLSGELSRYTVLARRSGSEWWVGGLTNSAQTVNVSFDYLESGKEYYAVLYSDGADKNDIKVTVSRVRSTDSQEIAMPDHGGFVLRLIPADQVSDIEAITPEQAVYTVNTGESVRVKASIAPANAVLSDLFFEVEDPQLAEVTPGGLVTGKQPGITRVIIKNHDGKVVSHAELRVARPLGYLKNDAWATYNGNGDYPVGFSASSPNQAKMTILSGDINGNPHMLLTDAAGKDFTLEVKLSGGLSKDFQSAGLVVYAASSKMITMERRSHSYFGGNVFCLSTHNGSYTENYVKETKASADAYLRLEKKGNLFTGYYSYDGRNWTKISQTITSAPVGSAQNLKIGIIARSGTYDAKKEVTFNDFKLDGEVIPFTIYNDDRSLCTLLPEELAVAEGKQVTLPETVRGYLTTGEFVDVPVTWSGSVDTSKLGSVKLSGKIASDSEYAGSGLVPAITVTVKAKSIYDLDGDEVLSIKDVTVLLRYLSAPDEVKLIRSGDFTGDSKVSAKDASRLLVLLGKEM